MKWTIAAAVLTCLVCQGVARAADGTVLTTSQRDSAGIVTAHPVALSAAPEVSAFGQVLDVAGLIADYGQVQSAQATEHAANADLRRVQGLYLADASASLKVVQSAEAEQARAATEYRVATANFAARWGTLATMPPGRRDEIIKQAADGHHLLVRASLLGRRTVDVTHAAAMLDVDGVQVVANVVGVMPQVSADTQNSGLLLEVAAAPAGLGPGARVPVRLTLGARKGALIPAGALLYTEKGAFVFKQEAAAAGAAQWNYVPESVKLIQQQGDGWLVSGLKDGDLVVTHGAAAIWSLQTANVAMADDDDDDG